MTAELHRKLTAIQNRTTAYEMILTDGTRTVLAWYGGKTRPLMISALRKNAETIVAFTGAEEFQCGRNAQAGITLGKWTLKPSGRTQREAYISGELPWYRD